MGACRGPLTVLGGATTGGPLLEGPDTPVGVSPFVVGIAFCLTTDGAAVLPMTGCTTGVALGWAESFRV